MGGHIIRGYFSPRCADSSTIDYSTAWPLQARIPMFIIAIFFFMGMIHPAIGNTFKQALWVAVKPFALLVGYFSVAIVRILIFIFIDGPKKVMDQITINDDDHLDVLSSLDVRNNTKLNAIRGRLLASEAEAWVPGGIFDKKYKPFLTNDNMKFGGPRQKKAMTRKRNFSC